jgi:hypothetical protein
MTDTPGPVAMRASSRSEVTAMTVMGFASPDYPYYTARNERGGGKLAAFGRKIGAADLFAEQQATP